MDRSKPFYVTGGTVPRGAPSYVTREADDALVQALARGDFCYVLTSRQMGKSSLMVRAADALRERGRAVATLSLTNFGQNLTAEQWYDGMLARIGEQLDLEDALDDWWDTHQRQGPLQRWLDALVEVALARSPGGLVLFVDEIDLVLSLLFPTDEFFAGIRELYNRRAQEPRLARLAVCLLGVASPQDLVTEPRLTPFNIGTRIELRDFSPDEAAPLASGLGVDDELAHRVLARVLYWTGGQPYLTQRLADRCAESGVHAVAGVDEVCRTTFLARDSRDKDHNLAFVSKRLTGYAGDKAALLLRYAALLRRDGSIADDRTDPLASELKLAGVARAHTGKLHRRNRIYSLVFDRGWVREAMPDAEVRRQRAAYLRGARRTAIAAGLLLALLGAGAYTWFDLYRKEHVAYSHATAKRWGVMEGVGSLTEAQRRGRPVSFKVVRRGREGFDGRVLYVESVDSADRCNPRHELRIHIREPNVQDPHRECRWVYHYDANGRVIYETALDRDGEMVWGLVYSPTAPGRDWHERRRAHYVGPDGYPQSRRDYAAEYVELAYDDQGFEERIAFQDRQGKPQPGRDGAYVQYREFDRQGLNTRLVSLDMNDRPMIDDAGNAEMRARYDAMSHLVGECAYDDRGQPVATVTGCHCAEQTHDERGNPIAARCFDVSGEPALWMEGFHRLTREYDVRGNMTSESYFGVAGEPVMVSQGMHRLEQTFDAQGNLVGASYFGTAGEAVLHPDGNHSVTQELDADGNVVALAYFGVSGEPVLITGGYHRLTQEFDERGNEIAEAYFGRSGEPVLDSVGVHRIVDELDERGNLVKRSYFGTHGEPVLHANGHHQFTQEVDARGKVISINYYDRAGEPVLNREGYHSRRSQTDERGNVTMETYFGAAGEPVLIAGGYHRIDQEFDWRGNETSEAYFGPSGAPVLVPSGFHRVDDEFDARGNTIRRAYFGVTGEPVKHAEGNHSLTQAFDEKSNIVTVAYFGIAGEAVLHRDGYHRRMQTWNERRDLVAIEYYGIAGEPVLTDNGYHRMVQVFDVRGNEIAEAYFGLSGEPVLSSNGAHLIIDEFDARGNVSARSYYGASGQAILHDGLHHRHAQVFDTKGNRLSESYFGVAGEPVLDTYGVHRYVSEVDAAGRPTSLATFGPRGEPVLNNNGIHRAEQAFDALGNLTAQAVFGIAGEPVTGPNGVHRTTYERDHEGNLLTTRLEGIEGIPLFGGEPPAVRAVVQEHDARGNVVVEAYFDGAGEPVADRNGHERIAITYGPSGQREAEHYFTDADDALPDRQITYLFDASGQAVGSRLAQFASHPEFGRYRIELEHDREGNLLSRRVLDSNGRDLLAGTVVDEILPDGVCARQDLDIRPGDIIVDYSGVAYPGMQAFVDLKSAEPPDGRWRPLTLERDGTELVVEVPPGLLGIGIFETPLGYADEALSAAQDQSPLRR